MPGTAACDRTSTAVASTSSCRTSLVQVAADERLLSPNPALLTSRSTGRVVVPQPVGDALHVGPVGQVGRAAPRPRRRSGRRSSAAVTSSRASSRETRTRSCPEAASARANEWPMPGVGAGDQGRGRVCGTGRAAHGAPVSPWPTVGRRATGHLERQLPPLPARAGGRVARHRRRRRRRPAGDQGRRRQVPASWPFEAAGLRGRLPRAQPVERRRGRVPGRAWTTSRWASPAARRSATRWRPRPARSAPPAAGSRRVEPVRAQRPHGRRPALRLQAASGSTALREAGRGLDRRRRRTSRWPWSATGTSPRPTTTSGTRRCSPTPTSPRPSGPPCRRSSTTASRDVVLPRHRARRLQLLGLPAARVPQEARHAHRPRARQRGVRLPGDRTPTSTGSSASPRARPRARAPATTPPSSSTWTTEPHEDRPGPATPPPTVTPRHRHPRPQGPADGAGAPTCRYPARLPGYLASGALVGCAEVVPGVSGGTLALVLGLYDRIITGVDHVVRGAVALVPRPGAARRRRAGRQVRWSVLVPVASAWSPRSSSAAAAIEPLLEDYPVGMRGLFFGFIAASVAVPAADGRPDAGPARLGGARAAAVARVRPHRAAARREQADPPLLLVALAAAVAVCALVLPGVSGSFFLLSIGLYDTTIGAVNDRDLVYLGVVLRSASVVGLSSFVRVVRWLLETHRARHPAGHGRAHDRLAAGAVAVAGRGPGLLAPPAAPRASAACRRSPCSAPSPSAR